MYIETLNKNVCHFPIDIEVTRQLFMINFSFFGPYIFISGVGLVRAGLWKCNQSLYNVYHTAE